MRKKWEIEDEYRKFCRNNKELALQTLRELTLTPTETGKEEQRIAYCVEWMKRQGMESVHTDELGNQKQIVNHKNNHDYKDDHLDIFPEFFHN